MQDSRINRVELVAWIGEDERGSGVIGLKQMLMPCGLTPLVGIIEHRSKFEDDGMRFMMALQATRFNKTIHFCRFTFEEELLQVSPDQHIQEIMRKARQ